MQVACQGKSKCDCIITKHNPVIWICLIRGPMAPAWMVKNGRELSSIWTRLCSEVGHAWSVSPDNVQLRETVPVVLVCNISSPLRIYMGYANTLLRYGTQQVRLDRCFRDLPKRPKHQNRPVRHSRAGSFPRIPKHQNRPRRHSRERGNPGVRACAQVLERHGFPPARE